MSEGDDAFDGGSALEDGDGFRGSGDDGEGFRGGRGGEKGGVAGELFERDDAVEGGVECRVGESGEQEGLSCGWVGDDGVGGHGCC